MNSVNLIGRLTTDIEVKYTSVTQTAITNFSIAIDRPSKVDGQKVTDFPKVVVTGKQAENCEKYLRKGQKVAVEGEIHTVSFEKNDGTKVYTTEVFARRVEFLEWAKDAGTTDDFQQVNDASPF